MKYDFFTPFTELSENLKAVVTALGKIGTFRWNQADDAARERMVREAVGAYVGKLDDDELAYLTDCNHHTAYYILSGE